MNLRLAHLVVRIRSELDELRDVIKRAEEGWSRAELTSDDYYLDGVALNLHGFYSGLERIFELISTSVDGSKPQGENWHQLLLRQMAREVPGVRPAVISQDMMNKLDKYRGFRHVVRNIYAYKFDAGKVKTLVQEVPEVYNSIQKELLAFAKFLEHQG